MSSALSRVGVVLINKRADRRRCGERAFRDHRINAEFFVELLGLQRQCMHQVTHIQNRRAFFDNGFLYVARIEVST